MVNFDEASNIILNSTKIRIGSQNIHPLDAINRTTAADIRSNIDFPAENNSAMDGFAINSSLTKNAGPINEIKLKVNEATIYAGDLSKNLIEKNNAIKIMTGGYMPSDFDAVIPIEKAKIENNNLVVASPVKKGLNVRFKGEDIKAGDKIFNKNRKLTGQAAVLITSCNVKKIRVYEDIPISIISTGNEIITPKQRYQYGKIYNSNGLIAESFLSNNGCRIIKNIVCKDKIEFIGKEIESALKTSKIIITSAGASFGEKDFTEKALQDNGLKIKFRQVAIKPAKPFSYGLINKIPVFMIPGNPVAFFVCLIVFVKPFIEKQFGLKTAEKITAKLSSSFHKSHDRTEFLPAKTFIKNGCFYSEVYNKIGPAMISSFGQINSIISIPSNITDINLHDNVQIYFI